MSAVIADIRIALGNSSFVPHLAHSYTVRRVVLSPKPDTHGLRSERVERAHCVNLCFALHALEAQNFLHLRKTICR
jgi:hypothetical protein